MRGHQTIYPNDNTVNEVTLQDTEGDYGISSWGGPEEQLILVWAIQVTTYLKVKQCSHSVTFGCLPNALTVTMKQF